MIFIFEPTTLKIGNKLQNPGDFEATLTHFEKSAGIIMQAKVNGSKIECFLEGPINENCDLYDYDIRLAKELILDLEKVTFINSIGVKKWILWTVRIPPNCSVAILKSPFMIVSQINTVLGFIPKNTILESFNAPFICSDCTSDQYFLLKRGDHFNYQSSTSEPLFKLPENFTCKKCNSLMEPDFVPEKAFAFLKTK